MAFLERRIQDCRKNSYFLQFAKDITSQSGEDGILEEIFKSLINANVNLNKYCVDIGAWDGKYLSNTYNLLTNNGWQGLLVEADVDRAKELQSLYEDYTNIQCVNSLVEIDGSNSLKCLLDNYNAPKDFDFLSIDIDGADYHVWKSLQISYQPKVVCIEFNPTIPNNIIFIQEPNTYIHQGSSLLAIVELGKSLGYSLLVTTLFNAILLKHM